MVGGQVLRNRLIIAKNLNTPEVSIGINSNTNANIVSSCINHSLKMHIRVHPISYGFFCNSRTIAACRTGEISHRAIGHARFLT